MCYTEPSKRGFVTARSSPDQVESALNPEVGGIVAESAAWVSRAALCFTSCTVAGDVFTPVRPPLSEAEEVEENPHPGPLPQGEGEGGEELS